MNNLQKLETKKALLVKCTNMSPWGDVKHIHRDKNGYLSWEKKSYILSELRRDYSKLFKPNKLR